MSLKTKIVIGIFLIYSIVISVLLIRSKELLNLETSNREDLKEIVDSLNRLNVRKLNEIPKFELKVDSLAVVLERVERGVMYLQSQKTAIQDKYKGRIEDLDGLDLDSLKQISLEK